MSRKPRKKLWIILAVVVSVLILCATFFVVSAVSAVKNVTISNTASGLRLRWSAVSGADFYEIYKVSSGSTKRIATVKSGSYTDRSVSYNNSYRYKIRSVKGKFKSSYVYISYRRLAAPAMKSVNAKGNSVTVKWNAVSGATGYILYRKSVDGAKWTRLASVDEKTLAYTDKASGNKTYSYAVKQLNGKCVSALSNAKSLNAGAARQLKVKNSPYGVVLSWKKFASDYKIEIIRRVNGNNRKIATISGTEMSYIDKTPSFGRKNAYVVRAITSSGQRDENSNVASLYAVNPNRKMVALTYDDGPNAPVTESILQTLKENNARATFYVVGSRLEEFKNSLIKEAQYGCEIGCHSYNHTILTTVSNATIKSEVTKTNNLIKKYTGQTVKTVRAPGGSVNDNVKKVVSYPLVNWSVDTLDWSNRSSAATFANFKANVTDGAIVLMHDLYPSTAEATKSIVSYLKQNGYQIVTVSELMDAKGVRFTSGNLYNSANS